MKTTQEQIVKEHLQREDHLSSIEAINNYGITRLSGVIFKLRKKGYEIETLDLQCKTRQGNPTTVALYKMRTNESN